MKLEKLFGIGTILVGSFLASTAQADRLTLNGAGASFPAPVYNVWTYSYSAAKLGAAVNYQSVGSGAGINQIKAGTVDFAGTDAPLTEKECDEAGLIQIAMLKGAVTPIVNLGGKKKSAQPKTALKLSPDLLAALFLGTLTRWDDPKLQALNPTLTLPKLPVTVVHRSDSSGTTFVYTAYLAAISTKWQEEVGVGASVKWPVGLGGQKNPGVCNSVKKVKGAIGYTEYTYAVESRLETVMLQDATGTYVDPRSPSWPLMGTTYILVRKDLPPVKMDAVKAYLRWCFEQGGEAALRLHYAPLSADDTARALETLGK
ncbi:MAG: phosphate ABC transporter substrate-binding protein PstS [Kiritimatiellia bacterium]